MLVRKLYHARPSLELRLPPLLFRRLMASMPGSAAHTAPAIEGDRSQQVEFWRFQTPTTSVFRISKAASLRHEQQEGRSGSGTEIRTLNLAVNRSLHPVQKSRPESTE